MSQCVPNVDMGATKQTDIIKECKTPGDTSRTNLDMIREVLFYPHII